MDKMREEFESWLKSHTGMASDEVIYSWLEVSMAWQAWQASRQALVVELPRMPYYDFDVDEIETALDAAGVKCVWVKK